MKTAVLSFLLLAVTLSAATLPEAVTQAKAAVGPATAAIADWLNAPVAWSTNAVQTVTTNDVTEVAVRSYLIANKPADVTAASTPAQIRAAWSNAVESATSANKPRVLSEQAIWMPAWFAYKTIPLALGDVTTNSTTVITPTQRRWQQLGLSAMPPGAQIEGAQ